VKLEYFAGAGGNGGTAVANLSSQEWEIRAPRIVRGTLAMAIVGILRGHSTRLPAAENENNAVARLYHYNSSNEMSMKLSRSAISMSA
jgi:hypothetical protein